MYMLRFYTVVLTSESILSLPTRAFGLVEIRARLAAKSSILISNTINAANLGKLRADGRHSLKDIKRIITLLELEKVRS
jgi:hypothetical protein